MAKRLDIDSFTGLSDGEAARRLAADGFNELPSNKQRSLLVQAWGVVREPMFLLLLVCGAVYLLLGEPGEAVMLLGFVFVVMGITLYQERKTERALEALRDLASPRALVIRDGRQRRIPGREVVRDDCVVVAEGDRAPADAVLLWCNHLSADESLLTGESVPVRKTTWDGKQQVGRPGGDDLPFVFSGSLIVQGQGVAKVLATGSRTEMGKIGTALQGVEIEGTLLQREVAVLVRNVAIFAVALCGLVVVVYGIVERDWLHGFLAGITLAMAMLPEEFPVVLAYDNLSGLSDDQSDLLAVVSTGGGLATRTLYANEEETVFEVCRPIILTGINEVVTRGDLLDRSLSVQLLPLSNGYRTREELWSDFEKERPKLLGALLSAVAYGLGHKDQTKLAHVPRMADFALWAAACMGALGEEWSQERFEKAYGNNRKKAATAALDNSPVFLPLLALLEDRSGQWPGTEETRGFGDLLGELDRRTDHATKKTPGWPKTARGLAGVLARLGPALRAEGVVVSVGERQTAKNKRVCPVRISRQ